MSGHARWCGVSIPRSGRCIGETIRPYMLVGFCGRKSKRVSSSGKGIREGVRQVVGSSALAAWRKGFGLHHRTPSCLRDLAEYFCLPVHVWRRRISLISAAVLLLGWRGQYRFLITPRQARGRTSLRSSGVPQATVSRGRTHCPDTRSGSRPSTRLASGSTSLRRPSMIVPSPLQPSRVPGMPLPPPRGWCPSLRTKPSRSSPIGAAPLLSVAWLADCTKPLSPCAQT